VFGIADARHAAAPRLDDKNSRERSCNVLGDSPVRGDAYCEDARGERAERAVAATAGCRGMAISSHSEEGPQRNC
jgi:hypothetical protein